MMYSRYNKKKIIGISVGILVFYLIFSTGYNHYSISVIINDSDPKEVWEYVADFSKMRFLNPTILDFTILKDHGNSDHWKYSVLYNERLQHWPYWKNSATADYSVRKLKPQEGGHYVVESEHKTCFFKGLYCLKSKGEFKISRSNLRGTSCEETVYYQCPPFLGAFCRREVEGQRRAIMKNLTFKFSKKN